MTGDGGFLMNMQELETAVRDRVPVVALVWRDDGYGVIRWNQMQRFGRAAGVELGNPDLVKLAESFGAVGMRDRLSGRLFGKSQADRAAQGASIKDTGKRTSIS